MPEETKRLYSKKHAIVFMLAGKKMTASCPIDDYTFFNGFIFLYVTIKNGIESEPCEVDINQLTSEDKWYEYN